MSSFKRRSTKQNPTPTGTRVLPGSSSNFITSTGIPSLDDILGGGLPLSCSQLILAPDNHSAYGELVQKYFIAQGLASGQQVCIVSERARDLLEECMWTPGAGINDIVPSSSAAEEEEDESAKSHDAKIKIAWRYEQMKQFQTTVSSSNQSSDDHCRTFDLTSRLPKATIDQALASEQLLVLDVPSEPHPTRSVLTQIFGLLSTAKEGSNDIPRSTRICIPSLGSPGWGDVEPPEICYFLHSLRALLRSHTYACASVSLPPHLCIDKWSGSGWIQKLGFLSDACISLSAFTANPSLSSMFPSHHGFVHIHSLPSPSSLLPPSDKFSSLRGLTSSGENNLAFKCMRKRLIFETLHLDVEGGVGERRTTPATTVVTEEATHAGHAHDHNGPSTSTVGAATIQVQVEEITTKVKSVSIGENVLTEGKESNATGTPAKKPKQKKKVAFHSERPDLYDF